MNRIRDLRSAAGMSQKQLGDRIGCHSATVSKFELEQRQLDPATICALCDIFGCTADFLLGRSLSPLPAVNDAQARLLAAYDAASVRDRALVDQILQLDVVETKTEANAS